MSKTEKKNRIKNLLVACFVLISFLFFFHTFFERLEKSTIILPSEIDREIFEDMNQFLFLEEIFSKNSNFTKNKTLIFPSDVGYQVRNEVKNKFKRLSVSNRFKSDVLFDAETYTVKGAKNELFRKVGYFIRISRDESKGKISLYIYRENDYWF